MPALSLMTEITWALEIQGLQNTHELPCLLSLFVYFCRMLWHFFFWCLQKILCSQEYWKVTRLSHLLPPNPKGKRMYIYWKQHVWWAVLPNRWLHSPRGLSKRVGQVRQNWKILIPPAYLFVWVELEFPLLQPNFSGQTCCMHLSPSLCFLPKKVHAFS